MDFGHKILILPALKSHIEIIAADNSHYDFYAGDNRRAITIEDERVAGLRVRFIPLLGGASGYCVRQGTRFGLASTGLASIHTRIL